MKCPTKEQILNAAKSSGIAKSCLKELFPEVFLSSIQPCEIYKWGTHDNGGGSGIVVRRPDGLGLMFINFHVDIIYVRHLELDATKADLTQALNKLNSKTLHNCYTGELRGPKYFKSWCTK